METPFSKLKVKESSYSLSMLYSPQIERIKETDQYYQITRPVMLQNVNGEFSVVSPTT